MIQIPTDCLLDAISKFSFRQPAKFCVDFCRIDSVAAVVAFAVFYVGNEAFRLFFIRGFFVPMREGDRSSNILSDRDNSSY